MVCAGGGMLRKIGNKKLKAKGLRRLGQEIPKTVLRIDNQIFAFYSDQPNDC